MTPVGATAPEPLRHFEYGHVLGQFNPETALEYEPPAPRRNQGVAAELKEVIVYADPVKAEDPHTRFAANTSGSACAAPHSQLSRAPPAAPGSSWRSTFPAPPSAASLQRDERRRDPVVGQAPLQNAHGAHRIRCRSGRQPHHGTRHQPLVGRTHPRAPQPPAPRRHATAAPPRSRQAPIRYPRSLA